MITLILLIASYAGPIYKDVVLVDSTTFSSKDEYNPNPKLACNGKVLNDKDFVVAHRTLPCNTKIIVCSLKGLCAKAKILDRGPYGISKGIDGKIFHTSSLDLSLAVAKKIKHSGFEKVLLFAPIKIKDKVIKIKGIKVRQRINA